MVAKRGVFLVFKIGIRTNRRCSWRVYGFKNIRDIFNYL